LSISERKAGHSRPCPNCRQTITIPDQAHASARALKGTPEDGDAMPSESENPTVVSRASPIRPGSTSPAGEPGAARHPLMGEAPGLAPPPDDRIVDRTGEAHYEELVGISTLGAGDRIALPRWIVYFQAGLLGVVASTFFVLGLMIGSSTGGRDDGTTELYECQLHGEVYFADGRQKSADEGAVVIVLPADARIMERPDPNPLRPDDFQAIDNPSIDTIESIGGRVVRINRQGEFDLTLTGPREYLVLVISRFATRTDQERIPKTAVADIGGFFFPAEDLIGEKKFFLTRVVVNRRSQNLPAVLF
jgi:hypothetical protein